MNISNKKFKDIDQFIESFPVDIQKILRMMRKTIHEATPDVEEAIRYGIPTFRLNNKNIVHFSAFAKHIGFYPTPSAIAAFKKELSAYKWAKGSVQFPFDKPIPYDLVKKIVKFRVKESIATTKKKE